LNGVFPGPVTRFPEIYSQKLAKHKLTKMKKYKSENILHVLLSFQVENFILPIISNSLALPNTD
jgi:hypothetical protein